MLLSKYYLLLDVGQDESVGPEGGLHHVQPHSPQLLPESVEFFNLNIEIEKASTTMALTLNDLIINKNNRITKEWKLYYLFIY